MFMSSLWLYAIFVSADDATNLGKSYLVMRSLYPVIWLVMGGENGNPDIASMFTFPQYAINLYEVVAVLLKLNSNADLNEYFFGYKSLGVFVFTVAFMAYAMGFIGSLTPTVFAKFFKAKK